MLTSFPTRHLATTLLLQRDIPAPDAQTLPTITEIAQGPQPTRGAIDEYRDLIAISSRENGQAARLALQGSNAITGVATAHTDQTLQADHAELTRPFADPRPPVGMPSLAHREVIPRDPAPEPRITLTL